MHQYRKNRQFFDKTVVLAGCFRRTGLIQGIDENSTGVRLTGAPDPGYDISFELDSNGENIINEPIPIFTYQGTAIPARQ